MASASRYVVTSPKRNMKKQQQQNIQVDLQTNKEYQYNVQKSTDIQLYIIYQLQNRNSVSEAPKLSTDNGTATCNCHRRSVDLYTATNFRNLA